VIFRNQESIGLNTLRIFQFFYIFRLRYDGALIRSSLYVSYRMSIVSCNRRGSFDCAAFCREQPLFGCTCAQALGSPSCRQQFLRALAHLPPYPLHPLLSLLIMPSSFRDCWSPRAAFQPGRNAVFFPGNFAASAWQCRKANF
jgi:hypothetical protein